MRARSKILSMWKRGTTAGVLFAVVACTPPTPEELLADARASLELNELRTAEIHLKNLLQLEPSNREGRAALGLLSLRTGDAAAAEFNLRAALNLGASGAELKLPLLEALLVQAKHQEVLDEIAAGPVLAGAEQVSVHVMEGAANRALRDYERAETSYRAALAIAPESARVKTELAAVLIDAGRRREALELVVEALADAPDFVPALLLRAEMAAAVADYTTAESTLKRVLEIEAPRPRGEFHLLALAGLVEIQLAAGNLAEAAVTVDALLAAAPEAAPAQYLKARVEFEQGALDSAERRLEQLITGAPEHWPAQALLGAINLRQGQLGQAEQYLRQAAIGNPSDARAQLLLTEVYVRQRNVGGARDTVQQSSAAGDPLFLALAGRASLDAGQAALAAEFFDRSERSAPVSMRQLADVVSVLVAAGELDRAIRILQSTTFEGKDADNAAAYLLTLVQLQQGDMAAADETARRLAGDVPEFLNLRGTVAMLRRDFAHAREVLTEATELAPSYVPARLNLARTALAENDHDVAVEHLEHVLEIEPAQLDAVLGLARLAAQAGDFAAAETWLARLPGSAVRYSVSGDLRMSQRQFDAAVRDYSRAFELQSSADLALRLSGAQAAAGFPDPDAVLRRWLEEHPGDATVNLVLGSRDLERNDLAAAVGRFEAIVAADERHAAALNNLAWIYHERGDARALEFAQRAREAAPADPRVADTLGWIYVERGEVARGLTLLEEAVQAFPTHPEIRYHRAVALDENGDRARAADEFAVLIAGDLDARSRADAEQRLARLRPAR